MKAFILAAGKGERLRPLTETVPKCLVSIRGLPLLEIWFELCRRHGIGEILVNTHAHSDVLKRYLQTSADGLDVHIAEEETLLGSAGTLLANRSWVESERDFWVFYSDVLTNMNLTRMLEFHRDRKQAATIGVYEVQNPSECGIVTADEQNIVREFVEKPAKPSSKLAFAGILLATPAILDVIPDSVPADLGFHVLPDLIGKMAAYRISDYLVDIGTPSNYRKAQLSWPGLQPAVYQRSKSPITAS